MSIYLDNAATTPIDPEVFEAMKPFMLEDFGNPSSTHSHGRKVRASIESARKKIAELLTCTPEKSSLHQAALKRITLSLFRQSIPMASNTPSAHALNITR